MLYYRISTIYYFYQSFERSGGSVRWFCTAEDTVHGNLIFGIYDCLWNIFNYVARASIPTTSNGVAFSERWRRANVFSLRPLANNTFSQLENRIFIRSTRTEREI